MSDETPNTVPFHYIKSNLFRVLHADGIVGGPTPNGLIFLGFYSERAAIPQITVHEITEGGQVGAERPDERVSKKGIVREVEIGATMSVETATSVITWLQEKVDLIQKVRKAAEIGRVQNESSVQ
jgi:hypothetical protein